MTRAEELLRGGRLDEALAALEQQVRNDPADAKLRVFLFQIFCVMGNWERALTQLNVAAEIDGANLLMAQVSRPALQCEVLRAEVFAGRRTPLVFGEPDEWVGLMIRANELAASGDVAQSQQLRAAALDAAPAVGGAIDHGEKRFPFEWIADADSRLGPILEAIIDGRYFWVPLHNVAEIRLEAPKDLRDLVWTAAEFTWSNGGAAVGLIPTRYPGSEKSDDAAIRMGRRTDWADRGNDLFTGLGQRLFATDGGEFPILEVNRIALGTGSSTAAETETAEAGSDGAGR